MNIQSGLLWVWLLAASSILAACTTPALSQPTVASLPIPTSKSTPTETLEPTAIPRATSTVTPTPASTPTPTLPPQQLDQNGFIQFGLLKVRVADDALYKDKQFVLNTKDYPEAQQILDRAILTTFAILRSGRFENPKAQAKQLADDIARNKGKFQVWAYKADSDGSVKYSKYGKGNWLTVDPAKGILLTLRTMPSDPARQGYNVGFGNSAYQFGITDDGQLVVIYALNMDPYGIAKTSALLEHYQSNTVKDLLVWMMVGHDSDDWYKPVCCEGKLPQLWLHSIAGSTYARGLETSFALLPTHWDPQIFSSLGDSVPATATPTPTPGPSPTVSASVATWDAPVNASRDAIMRHGTVEANIINMKRGSKTFTLELDNKNTNQAFTSFVYQITITDDVTGSSPYQFDTIAMFDAGFAIRIAANQSATIEYVLTSPINDKAQTVYFKLSNVNTPLYNPDDPSKLLSWNWLPALQWQITLP